MKEVYLIRHTTPAVARGICYGQTDLDVTESFLEEAELIKPLLPADITVVYSSPLQRCSRLAGHLFPGVPLLLRPELMELHCGGWEMRPWDELPPEEVDPWMADFVHTRVPGGESYIDLYQRVIRCWEEITAGAGRAAVIAHGGVIRSILSGITGTPLIDSFKVFSLHYGCVVRVFPGQSGSGGPGGPGGSGVPGGSAFEVLLNTAPPEKEQHKPASYYKKFT